MGKTFKYFMGYLIGGSFFMVFMPCFFFAVGYALSDLSFAPVLSVRFYVAAFIILIGLYFIFWSLIDQKKRGQGGPLEFCGVAVSPKTEKLVVGGPYRLTRNPMVFGAATYYVGWCLFFGSFYVFSLAVILVSLKLLFLKKSEEPRLLRDFGEEYEAYRKSTSFFFPCRK